MKDDKDNRTGETTMNLTGNENQVAWAEDIRSKLLDRLSRIVEHYQTWALRGIIHPATLAIVECDYRYLLGIHQAGRWIDDLRHLTVEGVEETWRRVKSIRVHLVP